MSTIREYLEEKAALEPREWMRREPRTTHPEILEIVREWEANDGSYDDDAEQLVNERAGDLPAHRHHGTDRDPLCDQLGHEVYVARRILDDEEASAQVEALRAEGYVSIDEVEIEDGAKYIVRSGTQYSGHAVPVFGDPREMRAIKADFGWMFLPKGARSRGYRISTPAMIKASAAAL